MSQLAIQLSCYNGAKYLPHILSSLMKQTFTDWIVYVTDNASTPEEAARVRAAATLLGAKAVYVNVGEKNIDFVGAHNLLFKQSQAPLVMLHNDDAVLAPDYLEKLVAAFDADAKLGAASGRILRWDFDRATEADGGRTEEIDSLGLERARTWAVSDRTTPPNLPFERGGIEPVFGVSGCLPMYRRAAVLACSPDGNLFDPAFVSYKEDVDLAFRMRAAGWTAVVVYDALAWHRRSFKAGSRAAQAERPLLHSYRNHLWILKTHVRGEDLVRDGWAIIPYEIAKAAYWFVLRPSILVKAWTQTWHHRAALAQKRAFCQHLFSKCLHNTRFSEESSTKDREVLRSAQESAFKQKHDIAVIIVCHNDLNAACLDSLQRARVASGLNVGVVIVDNQSTAIEAPKVAWDSVPDAIFVQRNFDAGYGSSMNRGAKEIDAEYVFILNPDTVLTDEQIFPKLVAFMKAHPEAGIAAPKLTYPDGRLQETVRRFPDWKLPFYQRSALGQTPKGKKYTQRFLLQDYDHVATRMVDWVQGSAMFLPMSLWRELGGFDDRFWMYFEDVDLCRRSWSLHRPVYYVPEAGLQHAFGKLSSNRGGFLRSVLTNKMARAHLISFAKYLAKWGMTSK